jgi:prevent-host-death family protein
MSTINIHEAKTHLSRLVDRAAAGEEIIIAKAGKPLAKLVSLTEVKPPVRFGTLAGILRIPDDFEAPLPPDLLEAFEA